MIGRRTAATRKFKTRPRCLRELQVGNENDGDSPSPLPASHEVRGNEVVVAGGVHVDVDVWGPADLARRDRAFEPKRAGRACGDACVAAPVIAAVRTSLPELDQRPTDRCATRIAQDPAGEDVAVSDPRASRCYGGIRLERPTTGRYARTTHGDGWRRRSGGHQNSCPYEHDCEDSPACQGVHREQSTLSRTTIRHWDFRGHGVCDRCGSGTV
jgi:hypothetical protein